MKSTKILTLNPIPSGVNQKLVPAKKYNELWDDVARIELKSYEPTIIVDKGLGSSILQIICKDLRVTLGGTNALTGLSRVSAFDVLASIHYVGAGPLEYFFRVKGDLVWSSSTDPSLAYRDLGCNEVGQQVTEVYVTDGSISSPISEPRVTVEDTNMICAF